MLNAILNIKAKLFPFPSPLHKKIVHESILNSKNSEAYNQRIGDLGEKIAASYLKKEKKYKILYRNFKAIHGGEVDIVCRDDNTLIFVEVKTRSEAFHGTGIEAVNSEKQNYIIAGATHWLRLLDYPQIKYRFDIVEVLLNSARPPDILQVENAFNTPINLYA